MTIYAPALAGLGEVNPYTADWRSLVGIAPAPVPVYVPAAPTPAKKGWLDSALTFVDNAMGVVDRGATRAAAVMEKYGQIKGKTQAATYQLENAYRRNVVETPRYLGDDWIPGIPNGALIGVGVGLGLLLVFSMKKGNA